MGFRRFVTLAAYVFVAVLPFIATDKLLHAQTTQTSPLSVDSTTSDIVKARTYTSEFVNIAKDNFKTDSKEYLQARKLYASAFANYSAWNAYVTSAIRTDHSNKLDSDPKYKEVTTKATESATAFTDYVSKNTGQDKAITTAISALADLGIEIWIKWSGKAQADRTAAATAFEAETKWQSWNEIIGGSAKESTTPTIKPSTPK